MRLNDTLKASKKNEFYCSSFSYYIYRFIFRTYLNNDSTRMWKNGAIGLLFLISSFGLTVQAQTDSIPTTGFAAFDESGVFHPYKFNRHPVGDDEIKIEILYSGICHSDLHNVHGDWRKEEYPMVPGHEIAGKVVAVGKTSQNLRLEIMPALAA